MLPRSPHQRGSSFCCKTQEVKTCNGSEYMVRIYGAWVINHSYITSSQVVWCADIFHSSPIWTANWIYTKRTPHLLYTIWYVYNCRTTERTGWNVIKPRLILAQIYIKLNRMISLWVGINKLWRYSVVEQKAYGHCRTLLPVIEQENKQSIKMPRHS